MGDFQLCGKICGSEKEVNLNYYFRNQCLMKLKTFSENVFYKIQWDDFLQALETCSFEERMNIF